jgi:DDE family transposase
MENRIKEQQLDLFADRTSCHRFLANQFRLLLSSAAYVRAWIPMEGEPANISAYARSGFPRSSAFFSIGLVNLSQE